MLLQAKKTKTLTRLCGYALWLAKGPMLLQAKKTKTLTRLGDMLYGWPRVQCSFRLRKLRLWPGWWICSMAGQGSNVATG